jgi:hypothetical protein
MGVSMLEMSTRTVTVLAMRLNSPLTYGASHIFTTAWERFVDVDGFPTTPAIPDLTFVDWCLHSF